MGKKNELQDVIELAELGTIEPKEATDIVQLLELTAALKTQIGVEPDEKKGIAGSGLLREYKERKQELAIYQNTNGLEGLRHGKLVFTCSPRPGREKLDFEKFCQFLVSNGVKAELIAKGVAEHTSVGEGFYVNEITTLK